MPKKAGREAGGCSWPSASACYPFDFNSCRDCHHLGRSGLIRCHMTPWYDFMRIAAKTTTTVHVQITASHTGHFRTPSNSTGVETRTKTAAQVSSSDRGSRKTLQNRKKCPMTAAIMTPNRGLVVESPTAQAIPTTSTTASLPENRNPGLNAISLMLG